MRLQNPVCAAGKKPGGSPQEGSEVKSYPRQGKASLLLRT